MTPPQKKVHHGRVKMVAGQVLDLADAIKGLNVPKDTEIEIRMGFERKMEAKVTTPDGIALADVKASADQVSVTTLSPTA